MNLSFIKRILKCSQLHIVHTIYVKKLIWKTSQFNEFINDVYCVGKTFWFAGFKPMYVCIYYSYVFSSVHKLEDILTCTLSYKINNSAYLTIITFCSGILNQADIWQTAVTVVGLRYSSSQLDYSTVDSVDHKVQEVVV